MALADRMAAMERLSKWIKRKIILLNKLKENWIDR